MSFGLFGSPVEGSLHYNTEFNSRHYDGKATKKGKDCKINYAARRAREEKPVVSQMDQKGRWAHINMYKEADASKVSFMTAHLEGEFSDVSLSGELDREIFVTCLDIDEWTGVRPFMSLICLYKSYSIMTSLVNVAIRATPASMVGVEANILVDSVTGNHENVPVVSSFIGLEGELKVPQIKIDSSFMSRYQSGLYDHSVRVGDPVGPQMRYGVSVIMKSEAKFDYYVYVRLELNIMFRSLRHLRELASVVEVSPEEEARQIMEAEARKESRVIEPEKNPGIRAYARDLPAYLQTEGLVKWRRTLDAKFLSVRACGASPVIKFLFCRRTKKQRVVIKYDCDSLHNHEICDSNMCVVILGYLSVVVFRTYNGVRLTRLEMCRVAMMVITTLFEMRNRKLEYVLVGVETWRTMSLSLGVLIQENNFDFDDRSVKTQSLSLVEEYSKNLSAGGSIVDRLFGNNDILNDNNRSSGIETKY